MIPLKKDKQQPLQQKQFLSLKYYEINLKEIQAFSATNFFN